jgi:hypothetical protein
MQGVQKIIPHSLKQGLMPFASLWKSPALFSFTITLILFSIQLFFIRPFYLVNDDIFKILTVKGIAADSTPSPFVGYSNILMGYMLMKLFAWAPAFPWYGWFLCLTQFLTFWVFLWLLLLKPSRWFHLSLFIGAWIGLFFIFFTYMQFTMTALLAAFAGFMSFFMSAEIFGRPRQRAILALSSLLLLLSAFIRMDSFFLALLVVLPLLMLGLSEKHSKDDDRLRRLFLGWVILGILFLAVANFAWYQKDKDWSEYRRFDKARAELQDYRITAYSAQSKPYFDSVGWSENDYWLFKNWYYANPAKFNADIFRKLSDFFPRVGSTGKTSSHSDLQELLFSSWDFRMMLCFFLLLIFCPRSSWKYLLAQWLWVLLVFLVLIYFYRAPDRVTLPIMAFLVMGAIFLSEKPLVNQRDGFGLSQVKVIILLVVFIFSLSVPWGYYRENLGKRLSQEQLHTFLAMVKPKDDQLYEVWSFPFEELSVFDNLECLKPFHLFLTSFCQTSPASLRGLERFGVREPLRDAVDNPRVLLVCSPEEGAHYYQYMKENYHQTIYAVPLFKCIHFEVFTIHSRKAL